MASLLRDEASGRYRIKFWFAKRQYLKSTKTDKERNARNMITRVEDTLADLEKGRLQLPSGADLWEFLKSGGKQANRVTLAEVLTLSDLRAWYFAQLPEGRPSSVTDRIHLNHFGRVLGNANLSTITGDLLQHYINTRSKEKRGGKTTKPDTIAKELATLSMVWKKASRNGKAAVPYPDADLSFPRREAKEPFRTWAELEASGKTTPWENLFLSLKEVETLLNWTEKRGANWFYPALVFAAHTGARRSEILRARKEDFVFDPKNPTVSLREKKRCKKGDTFRTVPMSTRLAKVMKAHFAATTGPYAIRGGQGTLTVQAMTDEFSRAFADSTYKVLKGYHTLRHSYASNLAAKGTDPGVIDELMGHQTTEMRERYRHLFPEAKRRAVAALFR